MHLVSLTMNKFFQTESVRDYWCKFHSLKVDLWYFVVISNLNIKMKILEGEKYQTMVIILIVYFL